MAASTFIAELVRGTLSGSTPAAASTSAHAASRRRNVAVNTEQAMRPSRRWPSPSRCSAIARAAGLHVEAHRGQAVGVGLDRDHALLEVARLPGRVDAEQQEAVDRAVAQDLEGVDLPGPVVGRVDEHHRVALAPRGGLGPAQHAPHERMGHVGHDQADRPRGPGAQRPRGQVRPVAELLGHGAHGRLGRGRHAAGGLAGQHERDRRLRDAGAVCDVDAGDGSAARFHGASPSWTPPTLSSPCRSQPPAARSHQSPGTRSRDGAAPAPSHPALTSSGERGRGCGRARPDL